MSLFRTSLRLLSARPRLLVSAVFGAIVSLLAPQPGLAGRMLIGWTAGTGLCLVLVWAMMGRSTYADMQRRADREDAGAAAVLILTMLGAVASLVAIAAELRGIKGGGSPDAGRLVLAGATILLTWLFVNTMFALHYAHDYYAGEDDRRGLKFPGDGKPDYWDFLYFAFNLGAAAQTSDVMIEAKRMRRFALAHTILSFLFNTTILALAVNVGASLL